MTPEEDESGKPSVAVYKKPSAFVGHSFDKRDYNLVNGIKHLLESQGIACDSGEKPKGESISKKILERIKRNDIFVGVFTRKAKLEGTDQWATSNWVIEEKAAAISENKRLLLLVEEGVADIGGLQGDYEYVRFDRSHLYEALPEIIDYVRASIVTLPSDRLSRRELSVIRGEKQVKVTAKTLARSLINHGFLPMLNEQELHKLVRDAISELKRGVPSPRIYDAFEKYMLPKLAGIVSTNRSYNILLESAIGYGEKVLRGTITYSCMMRNQSELSLPLFDEDIVCSGITTIPYGLEEKPPDPEEVFSFKEFLIKGNPLSPKEYKENIRWDDSTDWKKGVKYEIFCHRLVEAKDTLGLSYVEEMLLDKSDYLEREFITFSDGVTQVNITHPAGLNLDLFWFGEIKKPSIRIRTVRKTATTHQTIANGVFFPGNGFFLEWRPATSS